jgi:peroxiredoxin family protein
MSGIDATLFFTFWGLDAITEKKVDGFLVSTVGNPSMGIPPCSVACPAWRPRPLP